jgi:hypothetical protein
MDLGWPLGKKISQIRKEAFDAGFVRDETVTAKTATGPV